MGPPGASIFLSWSSLMVLASLTRTWSILGRLAGYAPEAFPIGWPDIRVDQTRRAGASENGQPLFCGPGRHFVRSVVGDAVDVGADDDVVEFQQRVVQGRRFLGEDIEPGAGDAALRHHRR